MVLDRVRLMVLGRVRLVVLDRVRLMVLGRVRLMVLDRVRLTRVMIGVTTGVGNCDLGWGYIREGGGTCLGAPAICMLVTRPYTVLSIPFGQMAATRISSGSPRRVLRAKTALNPDQG